MADGSTLPHQRWWVAALGIAAGAAGAGFAISSPLGIALTIVAVGVFIALTVVAFRFGRERRRAGHNADIPALQERLRKRLKWHLLLVVLVIVTSGLTLAHNDHHTPTWVLVAPPVLLTIGAGLVWVLAHYLLPRAQRRQAAKQADAQ